MNKIRSGVLPVTMLVCSLCAAAPQAADLTKLPLAFEPNRGHGEKASQYFARGAGYGIALRPGGAAISIGGKAGAGSSMTIRFVDASATEHPVAEDPLPGKVNYFIGSDSRRWQTDVPTFGAVRYPRIYPGIDLVYYGQQGRLEFDFKVQAGSDPSPIH